MLELRALTKDKPYDSLENVLWWIEFVMRHNGAPHLHFNGADTTWYQQFDLDIIVFLSIILFLILYALLVLVGKGLRFLYKYYDINNRLHNLFKSCIVLRMFATKKIKST